MIENTRILNVSRLVALLRDVVEENFVEVWVAGEISNLALPGSGHVYFTLKDEQAQLRAVLFRPQLRLLPFRPENGMQVVCCGRVSLYQPRGELQLVVESMEPRGIGALQLAYEQLKSRLAAEGLFASERKRRLPEFPHTIGVVTSLSGAVIHDILKVLRRRALGVEVLICPVRVQGEGAAQEIAAAIGRLNRERTADVVIVARGGGSLEDLWAFNEEQVVRAIAGSQIPVISAVGHETDVTLADLAADLRAPTPSAAAEVVARSRFELEEHLDHLALRLAAIMRRHCERQRGAVAALAARFVSPRSEVRRRRERVAALSGRLESALRQRMLLQRGRLDTLGGRLHALSPLQTLARGYAVVTAGAKGAVIDSAASLRPGDRIEVRFHRGRVRALVEESET